MKKKERKALQLNLLISLKDVLANNRSVPTKKTEKDLRKSVKKIANMDFKKEKNISKKEIENDTLIKKIVLK